MRFEWNGKNSSINVYNEGQKDAWTCYTMGEKPTLAKFNKCVKRILKDNNMDLEQ